VNSSESHYEVRIDGRLGPRWSAWLDGMDIAREADGTTVLRGTVVDQAALHGLLSRLRDIGLPLISVTRVEPAPPPETADHPDHPTGDRHVH
jgi:hypothetical protein